MKDERLYELDALLKKRWILKSEDPETYYAVRDRIGAVRNFATEKMGCQVIENHLLVKMEKIPVHMEPAFGISDFRTKEDYALLCFLLMFLEDRETDEQFILSQLTEYLSMQAAEMMELDWTEYRIRKMLCRVLQFAVKEGLLRVIDGSEDTFVRSSTGEGLVLYENTGASRYLMRSFAVDISGYEKPEDFERTEWYGMDEDKGIARRHRVYKRLIFGLGLYRNDGMDEDFDYIKNWRNRINEDFDRYLDCRLDVHVNSAYLLTGESSRMGNVFPNSMKSGDDVILLVSKETRRRLLKREWQKKESEDIEIDEVEWAEVLRSIQREYGSQFSKGYGDIRESEFIEKVTEDMKWMGMIRCNEESHTVTLRPVLGKVTGAYGRENEG